MSVKVVYDKFSTSSLIVPSAHPVPVTTELQPAPIDSESVASTLKMVSYISPAKTEE